MIERLIEWYQKRYTYTPTYIKPEYEGGRATKPMSLVGFKYDDSSEYVRYMFLKRYKSLNLVKFREEFGTVVLTLNERIMLPKALLEHITVLEAYDDNSVTVALPLNCHYRHNGEYYIILKTGVELTSLSSLGEHKYINTRSEELGYISIYELIPKA